MAASSQIPGIFIVFYYLGAVLQSVTDNIFSVISNTILEAARSDSTANMDAFGKSVYSFLSNVLEECHRQELADEHIIFVTFDLCVIHS